MFTYCVQKDAQRLRYHDFTFSGKNPYGINASHFHLLEIYLKQTSCSVWLDSVGCFLWKQVIFNTLKPWTIKTHTFLIVITLSLAKLFLLTVLLILKKNGVYNDCYWSPVYLFFGKISISSRKLHIFYIVCIFLLFNLHRTYIRH